MLRQTPWNRFNTLAPHSVANDAAGCTAKLETDAAQLQLENTKLQALIQPRSLSLEQQREIGEVLSSFKGRRLIVSVVSMNDPESYNFGVQILAAMKYAKLNVEFSSGSSNGRQYSATDKTGVEIGWAARQKDLADAVGQSLDRIGHVKKLSRREGVPAIGRTIATDFLNRAAFISVYPKPFDVLPEQNCDP